MSDSIVMAGPKVQPGLRRHVDRAPATPSYSPAVNAWLEFLADRLAAEFLAEHAEGPTA